MADFTQSILRDYAQKKAGESKQGIMDELLSYGSTTSPTPYNLAANNYQGMITKGIGGLVDFAQSGERRAAAEAQQKLDAEETAYQRGRDTLRDSISLETNQRDKEQFDFNKATQTRELQKELDAEQKVKNTILFKRNAAEGLAGYGEQHDLVNQTVQLGSDKGFLQGDDKGNWKLAKPEDATPEEMKEYDAFAQKYNTLPDLSAERKKLETQWKKRIEDSLVDNDKSNDIGSVDTANIWDKYNKSSEQTQASAEAQIGALDTEHSNFVKEKTGALSGKDKEFLNDYSAIGGNLEVAPSNFDNYINNGEFNEENKLEANRLRKKFFKDDRLGRLSDVAKNWVIGSALKESKGLGEEGLVLGEWIDGVFTAGLWADDRVSQEISKELGKLSRVMSASEAIAQNELRTKQLKNNIVADLSTVQGRSNLLRKIQ